MGHDNVAWVWKESESIRSNIQEVWRRGIECLWLRSFEFCHEAVRRSRTRELCWSGSVHKTRYFGLNHKFCNIFILQICNIEIFNPSESELVGDLLVNLTFTTPETWVEFHSVLTGKRYHTISVLEEWMYKSKMNLSTFELII